MTKNFLFLLTILLLLGLQSCSSDVDNEPTPQSDFFNSGSFIISEGQFGSGTGSIIHIGDDNTISPDIYQSNNDGDVLGNIVQSMIVHNSITLISINNAAKIIGVISGDFTKKYQIDDIAQPRYFAEVDEEHVIASAWGATGFDGSIYKIKSSTGEIVSKNNIGGAPEKMIVSDDKIYITMSNGFQSDNRVLILNGNDLSINSELTVERSPNAIAIDENDNIWVTSGGFTDFAEPSNNTAGSLSKIVNDQVIASFPIANSSNGIAVDSTSVFFLNPSGLIKANKSNLSETDTLFGGDFYAMGINNTVGELWLGDAKKFLSNGEVTRINKNGNVLNVYPTDFVPSYFHFSN